MVRCRFRLDHATSSVQNVRNPEGNKDERMVLTTLTLSPVPLAEAPENAQVYARVPQGQLQLTDLRPEAAKGFEVGQEYILELSPAPKAREEAEAPAKEAAAAPKGKRPSET